MPLLPPVPWRAIGTFCRRALLDRRNSLSNFQASHKLLRGRSKSSQRSPPRLSMRLYARCFPVVNGVQTVCSQYVTSMSPLCNRVARLQVPQGGGGMAVGPPARRVSALSTASEPPPGPGGVTPTQLEGPPVGGAMKARLMRERGQVSAAHCLLVCFHCPRSVSAYCTVFTGYKACFHIEKCVDMLYAQFRSVADSEPANALLAPMFTTTPASWASAQPSLAIRLPYTGLFAAVDALLLPRAPRRLRQRLKPQSATSSCSGGGTP